MQSVENNPEEENIENIPQVPQAPEAVLMELDQNEVEEIDLVSPSKKKRRRSTPVKLNRDEDDDDGATCTICLDNFQSAGPHRIVSLKCGHIFGESCINRWLIECGSAKNCPQCKTKCTKRDLRFIYATKIRVSDNSYELELKMQIDQLQEEKARLVNNSAIDKMTMLSQSLQIRRLNEELEQLRNHAQIEAGRATAGIRSIKSGRIYLEKNIDLTANLDSRLLKFLTRNKKLIVTQKSAPSSLFPGFGVKLIDYNTSRGEKFINTSNKCLNDFSIDQSETFILTSSKDPTCKLHNISSCAVVNTFAPSTVPIWSCSFDYERPQNVYLGAQNGTTYIYDTRNCGHVLKEVQAMGNRSPVKNIIPMKKTETFPFGGFFVIQARGFYFYECSPTDDVGLTALNFNDPILSASYDDRTEMLLITKSPTGQGAEFKQSKHILMKLVKEEGVAVLQEIFSFNGSNSTLPSMSRPTQIKVPDGFIIASYLQDTKMLQVRTPQVGLLHETSVIDAINDICPIYIDNTFSFGALSHSRCRLFKVNLGY